MAFHMAQNVKLLKNKSFALMMFAGTKVCIFHGKTHNDNMFSQSHAIKLSYEAKRER